jgi:microsomal dipeptidase-like Zn-dependent dipeptidase
MACSAKILVVAIVLLIFIVCTFGCASLIDRALNKVVTPPPYHASYTAEKLHMSAFVADLHADSLLWNRNLLAKSSYGHVDLPRLQEGHVGLQIFTVVSKVPLGLNFEQNTAKYDMITLLSILQARPLRTWSSLLQRTLYQVEKLRRLVNESEGALMLITNRRELQELVDARSRGEPVIGALLGIEGAHALEGDITNLDLLYDQGLRVLGLCHFFDNDMAGSAHGMKKEGLTELGRQLVRRTLDREMLMDLVHASPQAIDDTLALTNRPVIVSHTGVRGTCDNTRNLSDHHVRGIAATGGLIGIALFEAAVCGKEIKDFVRAVRYVAGLVGVEHVALGSDFDGAGTMFVDASGLVLLTDALMEEGFSAAEIEAILGGNVLRVLRQTLPE